MLNALVALFGKFNLVVWVISLIRAFLYSLIVTGTAALQTLTATPCTAMDLSHRILFVIGLVIIQAGVMLAFLDKTISELSAHATAQPNQKGN